MKNAGKIIAVLGVLGILLSILGFVGTLFSPAVAHVDFEEQIPGFIGSAVCCGLSIVPIIGGLVMLVLGGTSEKT